MIQVNPGALSSAARSFNSSAKEWRAAAGRFKSVANETVGRERWAGEAAQVFQLYSESLFGDLTKISDAFETAAGALTALAKEMEEVERMRKQASRIEHDLRAYQNDEEYRNTVREMRRDVRDLRDRANRRAEEADRRAKRIFDEITAVVGHLVVAHGGRAGQGGNGRDFNDLPEPWRSYYRRHPELYEQENGGGGVSFSKEQIRGMSKRERLLREREAGQAAVKGGMSPVPEEEEDGWDTFKEWLSLGVGMIPLVGNAKGFVEAVTGEDLITGEELSATDRTLGLLGAYGKGGKLIKAGERLFEGGSVTGREASQWVARKNNEKTIDLCFGGDPVDLTTGAQIIDHPVLTLYGATETPFLVQYNSLLSGTGVLGEGWTHNHEMRLDVSEERQVTVWWNNVRRNVFWQLEDGTFRSGDKDVVYDVLTWQESEGVFCLKQPDQAVFLLNEEGRLLRKVNRVGQAVEYAYDGCGRLSQIRDGVTGRALVLAYNADGLLAQVSDAGQNTVVFAYDWQGYLQSITDPNGHPTGLTYDVEGRLVSVTYASGDAFFKNEYDEAGRIVRQEDAIGHAFTFEYDEDRQRGLLTTTITDRAGYKRVLYVDSQYQLCQHVDQLGHVTRFAYDAYGNLVRKADAEGHETIYRYDERGNLLQITDVLGHSTTYTYDERNNLLTETNALGHTTKYAYDAGNLLTSVTDAEGHTTSYSYNENGQLLTKTDPNDATWGYVYDEHGNITATVDPEGLERKLSFDATGRIVTIIDALGGVTARSYDRKGNVTSVTDPLGRRVSYSYNSEDDLIAAVDPAGNTNVYTYDALGNVVSQTTALGQVTRYEYDMEGRLLQVIDPQGHATSYEYDPAGRPIQTTDATGGTYCVQYDSVGRVISVVDGLGNTIRKSEYDAIGNPVAITDALGRTAKFRFNALGMLTESESASGHKKQLTYNVVARVTSVLEANEFESRQSFDTNGRLTSYLDPNGNQTELTYDASGRLLSEQNAAGGTIRYTYNALGRLSSRTNARGEQARFEYDAAGQLVEQLDQAGHIKRTYDVNGNLLTMEEVKVAAPCDGQDLVSLSYSKPATKTRTYDSLNRVTANTDERGHKIQYGYDDSGNLSCLIYPDGKQVQYGYDAAGRMTHVTDWHNRTTVYEYDLNGRLVCTKRPNGTVETRTYDAQGQLTQIRDCNAMGLVLQQFRFTYDLDGNIVQENDAFYKYDSLNRLIHGKSTQYAYDKGGNLTTIYPEVQGQMSSRMTYGADNRMATWNGVKVEFDADGNLLSGPLKSRLARFTYDGRNRLIAAGDTRYAYDAENLRTSLTSGGKTTHYVINPHAELSQLLMETDEQGTSIAYYVYGLGLIGREDSLGYKTYHYDLRGSTTLLTDDKGTITDRYTYGIYGDLQNRTGITRHPFLYNGRDGVMSDPNGLYYMRSRYYHPDLKRFLNRDIVRGDVHTGQTYNRFTYLNGDPIYYIDPFGLSRIGCEGTGESVQKTSPSQLAQSWQGKNPYLGIDKYRDIKLNKGKIIYVGEPFPTGYATTESAMRRAGADATRIFEGLQVKPYWAEGMVTAKYRETMMAYEISEEVEAAFGVTRANPQFGKGGLPQMFIPDFNELVNQGAIKKLPNKAIPLKNAEISYSAYEDMMDSIQDFFK